MQEEFRLGADEMPTDERDEDSCHHDQAHPGGGPGDREVLAIGHSHVGVDHRRFRGGPLRDVFDPIRPGHQRTRAERAD